MHIFRLAYYVYCVNQNSKMRKKNKKIEINYYRICIHIKNISCEIYMIEVQNQNKNKVLKILTHKIKRKTK